MTLTHSLMSLHDLWSCSLVLRYWKNVILQSVSAGHTLKCVWGFLAQHINGQLVGGPTESRRGKGSRAGACWASISACDYILCFRLAFAHTYLSHIFFCRNQNHMDHNQNCSRGKINVTMALLWKRRQAVKCLNGGHSCSILQKQMIFLKYIMNPLNQRTTDEDSDLNGTESLTFH